MNAGADDWLPRARIAEERCYKLPVISPYAGYVWMTIEEWRTVMQNKRIRYFRQPDGFDFVSLASDIVDKYEIKTVTYDLINCGREKALMVSQGVPYGAMGYIREVE